jgi:hypothetical protein
MNKNGIVRQHILSNADGIGSLERLVLGFVFHERGIHAKLDPTLCRDLLMA